MFTVEQIGFKMCQFFEESSLFRMLFSSTYLRGLNAERVADQLNSDS